MGEGGKAVKEKHAIPTQNAFRAGKAAAEAKGMRVNTLKMKLLCISNPSTYQAAAFIEDEDSSVLRSGKPPGRLKLLGFTFGNRPTVRPHIMTIQKKFRQRFWTLYNLKKNGFTNEELVRVYKTAIHPVADHLDVVYHSLLPDDLDEELNRLQNHALRIIFGTKIGGGRLRQMAGIPTLRARRIEHCDNFVAKCLKSDRFSEWFTKKCGRMSARHANPEKYIETFARCSRLCDTPLHFFCRHLNGKEGKKYGGRYREYRED